MQRTVIQTEQAPKAIGPYSQGIAAEGKFVFLAGQVGVDPNTGKLVDGGIEAQARQALENVRNILASVGATMENVVKSTVLLHSIQDFQALNGVYATYFTSNPPARSTFGGLELPLGALVEIECIAVLEK